MHIAIGHYTSVSDIILIVFTFGNIVQNIYYMFLVKLSLFIAPKADVYHRTRFTSNLLDF